MTQGKLHVFAGSFDSRADACLNTQEQWEPEPGEEVSDAEFAAWEDRNPTWGLSDELGIGLDSDFVETIDDENRFEYLRDYLISPSDLDMIRAAAGESNILVLIFPDALHEPDSRFVSTSKMKYCGSFDFRWP